MKMLDQMDMAYIVITALLLPTIANVLAILIVGLGKWISGKWS